MSRSSSPDSNNGELRRSDAVRYVPLDQENFQERKPTNAFVAPLLTDMYQITMAYSLWKNNRHNLPAAFDLFFRKNPFGGEFTIFAGLEEVLRFVSDFNYDQEHIEYLRTVLPSSTDPKFFEWLASIDCSDIKLYSVEEGTVVFPRIPLIRVEGPMAIAQLLESTLLCLVNYPSLVATNAARHRLAVGPDKTILEFGLRRAQGPDGSISATRYSYLGGADGSSNTMAGYLFDIPIRGTMAHSYITSFASLDDFIDRDIVASNGEQYDDFFAIVKSFHDQLGFKYTNFGELIAFTAYARTFPDGFLALVDTYDTLQSGIKNFVCVALALDKLGYKPLGIRLDSGDLAYLSVKTRELFRKIAQQFDIEYFEHLSIAASNDLNETTISSLNAQGHEIDIFAIGTNLVTCQSQPALGCVYKLVEVEGDPRIKLSQEVSKVTLAGRKEAYRLYGSEGHPLLDLLINLDESAEEKPQENTRILCHHPFEEQKRVYVTPQRVEPLHKLVWSGGKVQMNLRTLRETREFCQSQIKMMREDHLRALNPAPYKVSVTGSLYRKIHSLWLREVPIHELE
eukprot:gb/GECH01013147.1/.p1 GENE.gb/GECH01013147.1/~~gb/GECH01013147.1/.p1  ORF type:complete len:568 (+),score=143.32 gb/GECH01013147.1/:1-1704(+)